MDIIKKYNRLKDEKSPYLLQHAENPVDWYPWSDEAFEKAKKEAKPIFLSIGYSTCHWCHVMAHESFEDIELAKLINDAFISIKVDREERPDIDNIYMTICQLLTGSGGWPLSIFMTPEKKPFYAATYIPKERRYGKIGLIDLINTIRKRWSENRNQLLESANKIENILIENHQVDISETNKKLDPNIFDDAFNDLKSTFDNNYGGFGNAPKFPMPHQNLFLLNYFVHSEKEEALQMVIKNLMDLRSGGIYDHLGFGFHRYSTDEKWRLPHFEKMLYDQGLLLYAYISAYQVSKEEIFKTTAEEIIFYLQRKMLSPEKAFYSAEDADSEGEEGKFYLWKKREIEDLLKEDSNKLISLYSISDQGNYYDESTGRKNSKNILYLNINREGKEVFKKEGEIKKLRDKLFKNRENRIHPHLDDKILCDWNGLLIASLAKTSFVLANKDYLKLAEDAAHFIINNMSADNLLLHRYKDKEAGIIATIEDYAFFIWGLIELYQASFKIEYLEKALSLNQELINHFWDKKNGGFFFTSDLSEKIIIRNKEIYDGAIPSGNSIALYNLIRLSHLTVDHKLEEYADRLINIFSEKVISTPTAYSQFLIALQSILLDYYDIILVGDKESQDTKDLLSLFRNNYRINTNIIFLPDDTQSKEYKKIISVLSYLREYKKVNNKTTAYICKNGNCQLPVTDKIEVLKLLND
ncbi:MAG: thioredoxin domain-containing protein [bacterium]